MAGNGISRRTLLGSMAGSVAGSLALAGCGQTRSPRYEGWLFVASAAESGIAVADLSEFRRATTIALPKPPRQILLAGERVFAACPDAQAIFEIEPDRLKAGAKIGLPGQFIACAAAPDGSRLAAITRNPARLYVIDPATRKQRAVALPEAPAALDLSTDTAAITTEGNSLMRVSLSSGQVLGTTPLGLRCDLVRFRKDGKAILTGAAGENQIVTVDTATGKLFARLPLAFLPRRFCFTDDGGQMFVTGVSDDSIVVVSPYQSEVDETMIGGQRPLAMAVAVSQGRNLLFVTNAGSGDLTIFDIDSRQMASSVHIGGNVGEVLITPDGNYAMVIDRDSGDASVVRMSTALDHKLPAAMSYGTRPLFTVFRTGGAPQAAAIVPKAV
ncbi:MAG: hypothetical protein KGN84_02280 [Acidobacteriota bacterium]|nr:hypothetical protein [Acidobacteriota bacterium]